MPNDTILVLFYFYYTYNIGTIQKGKSKTIIAFILCIFTIVITYLFKHEFVGWILITLIMMFFDLFYDEEPFVLQWYKVLSYGLVTSIMLLFISSSLSNLIIYEIILLLCFIMLSNQRKCLTIVNGILVILTYLIIIVSTIIYKNNNIDAIMFILSTLIFLY